MDNNKRYSITKYITGGCWIISVILGHFNSIVTDVIRIAFLVLLMSVLIYQTGIKTDIRYNVPKDTAYVRIFSKVDETFLIDTPHVFSGGYEFVLGRWFGKWMIYQFGGHLDSIYEKKKTK